MTVAVVADDADLFALDATEDSGCGEVRLEHTSRPGPNVLKVTTAFGASVRRLTGGPVMANASVIGRLAQPTEGVARGPLLGSRLFERVPAPRSSPGA